jgi:hypothetical protein
MMTRVLGAILWKFDLARALSLREWIMVFGVATLLVMTLVFEARAVAAACERWL